MSPDARGRVAKEKTTGGDLKLTKGIIMSELPKLDIHFQRYRSHKIIEAFKIASIVVENDGIHHSLLSDDEWGVFVDKAYMEKHNPQIGGYFVRYPDGYQSWSPAQAFEDGYTAIPLGDQPIEPAAG